MGAVEIPATRVECRGISLGCVSAPGPIRELIAADLDLEVSDRQALVSATGFEPVFEL
jgi:hypothetical protein